MQISRCKSDIEEEAWSKARDDAERKFRENFLDKYYESMRDQDMAWPKNVRDDWVPSTITSCGWDTGLFDVIYEGIAEGIISKGQKVLDLGSGDGRAAFTWAYFGFNAQGIELHEPLKRRSEIGANACRNFHKDFNVDFMLGSYYPKGYLKLREKGDAIAPGMEEEVMREEKLTDGFNAYDKFSKVFHPIEGSDPYGENGISLKNIDIFFAYVWKIQAPSVAEIFKLYSKKDATLCLVGAYPKNMLDKLGLYHAGEGRAGFYLKKKKFNHVIYSIYLF